MQDWDVDVLMESKTADLSVKLAFVKNRYIGQVRGEFLSCGNEPVQVARDFKPRPNDADLVHDTWIATEISGFLGQKTVKTGGCLPASERFAVRGKRG